jgi:hypothetical protein
MQRLVGQILVVVTWCGLVLHPALARYGLERLRFSQSPQQQQQQQHRPIFGALQFQVGDCIKQDDDTKVEGAVTAAVDETLTLIQQSYPYAYYNSTISHHYFVRMAPRALQIAISKLVWTADILRSVISCIADNRTTALFGTAKRSRIVRDVYDEICLMRPEVDFVDEYKSHYDGILKVPGLLTLRSLTYLQGGQATLVAATSGRNYTTDSGSTIILDFNRELRCAITCQPTETNEHVDHRTVTPTGSVSMSQHQYIQPRVMIKAAVHVFDCQTHPFVVFFHIVAHRLINIL